MTIKKKERHILALSGGKDSAALAVYMKENYPDIPLEYVFTDSGYELPETYEYLEKIRAILNIDINIVKSKQNFDYWLKYFNGVLPSPNNRWCTRLLKLKPFNDWIKLNYKNHIIYNYAGLRADENRDGFRSKPDFIPKYPFVDNGIGLKRVIEILNNSGLGLPKYYSWRKRSGCFFCFFQKDSEWIGLKANHPSLFEKACSYEENHADERVYTWRSDGYLKDIECTQKNEFNDNVNDTSGNNLLCNSLSKFYKNKQNSQFVLSK
ncbi:MAG: phosphoadenosine phosphosulfate reductase family protein [Candidatus Muiribacteriota bacterium]